MAIKTDEDLENVFKEAIEDVITNISDRAQKLLRQHINTDTYGISKTAEFSMGKINQNYLLLKIGTNLMKRQSIIRKIVR